MKYSGASLKEILFPLGGIGSGCIGLRGNGQLADFEIYNRPNKNSINGYSHFAIRTVSEDGTVNARILNGDVQKDLMGTYNNQRFSGYGFGYTNMSMCGFPHFRECEFNGDFPFAEISLSDSDFDGDVKLKAFNPMIPGDSLNSSIPAAFFTVTYTNTTDKPLRVDVAFSMANPFNRECKNTVLRNGDITAITLNGTGTPFDSNASGDVTIAALSSDANAQAYWYRGGWQDKVVTYWNEFSSGKPFCDRKYDTEANGDHATLCVSGELAPGETYSADFVFSWSIPENYNYWIKGLENDKWKNYYATVWKDSEDSAAYSLKNFRTLEERTARFVEILKNTTVDPVVLEAATSTMSVLKSPTVLRLENGEFYGWEGVMERQGSCEGTCQHVWNYAYALCFLYPELERSIRDLEFKYSMDDAGGLQFRLRIPVTSPKGTFRPCVDGQMGTVFKVWREWKISGDTDWMLGLYPSVKKALSYTWSKDNYDEWDKDHSGVLTGRQHHTLDMELFGPSSWLEGFYLLALKAMTEMSAVAGDTEFARECSELFEKGKAYTEKELFNGKYFIQRIKLDDLDIPKHFGADNYVNTETGEIKYQIGEGSEIDQMCAQWHANILGLGRIFTKEQTDIALKNMYKNNFKSSMRAFANPWRIFALNDEAGSVICDYPDGAYKPKIPIPYCEEAMHGFEYQFAGLLISEGMIEEGLSVVRAVRERYRGHNRNPWNEIECGSNYARSMASFALIPIFAGFTFDMPNKKIGFAPICGEESYSTFWAVDGAYGEFSFDENGATLTVAEGKITLEKFGIKAENVGSVFADGECVSFTFDGNTVSFESVTVKNTLEIKF